MSTKVGARGLGERRSCACTAWHSAQTCLASDRPCLMSPVSCAATEVAAADAANTIAIMELLQRLNRERRVTVIAVTHDPAVLPFATKVVTLRDGVVV